MKRTLPNILVFLVILMMNVTALAGPIRLRLPDTTAM